MRELGRGGMGTVYLCEDTAVGNRLVALKVVHDPRAAGSDMIERFRREIRNLGVLRHPNLVQVLYAGEHEGHPYFVMEYVRGRELNKWLDEIAALPEPQRISAIVRLMAKVAHGVAHAHQNGTIHRDLKPQNILVREDGEPMVLDFGIAKHREDTTLTATTATPGTPSHMAPEQFEPLKVLNEELVDVWALGTILYFALARERPFKGQSLASVSYQIVHATPTPLRRLNTNVPPALEALALQCLEKDPRKRPQSAKVLAERLESALGDVVHADRRNRRRTVALVACSVLVLAALAARPWRWWPRAARFDDLKPVVERVGGQPVLPGELELALPTFQPAIAVRFDEPTDGAMLEAALETDEGVELARALLAPNAGQGHEASLLVPADRQREALRTRVRIYANGELVRSTAPALVLDTSPPRVAAAVVTGGVERAWDPGADPIEVESGSELRVVVTDPSVPVEGEWEVDGSPGPRFGSAIPIAAEGGPWRARLTVRDAAGNTTVRTFAATVAAPGSRPESAASSRTVAPEPDLPAVWGRITRVGSQTRFDAPVVLKMGENAVLVENALFRHDFKWRLRIVDASGAAVAECELLPEAFFGTASARTLGGRLVMTTPQKGRLLTAEFMITDPAGQSRIQPVPSPQFLEGALKPKVRFKTPRGDLVVELDRMSSPAAVEAFLDHVRKGDYDGTVFHELRKDQLVRGGVFDDRFRPKAGPRLPIPADWTRPKPTADKMTVALTGQAEFLVNVRDNPSLAMLRELIEIGRVVEGEELVAGLARDPVTASADLKSAPVKPVAITKATVLDE